MWPSRYPSCSLVPFAKRNALGSQEGRNSTVGRGAAPNILRIRVAQRRHTSTVPPRAQPSSFCPPLLSQEGDEATGDRALLRIVIPMAGDDQELLARHTAYRDDQTTTFSELREQGLRHVRCCRSNNDAVVRRLRGQAQAAIADHDLDIGISQAL